MPLPLILGCDGGGSGCRMVVMDAAGCILARAQGGPANIATDFGQAMANLRATLADVAAQLDPQDISQAVAHFGLAGVMTPQDAARAKAALPFARITVTEDREVALAGALGAEDGVLLAIGTGTIIAAQRRGQRFNVGGWGIDLSDQASGAWLGRGLLEQVLLCHDGVETGSDLTRDTFAGFSNDPAALAAFAATAKAADFARFAPHVVAAATAGDPVGRTLMQRGATYLDRALAAVRFASPDALCLTGGVGPHYAPYLSPAARAAIVPPKGSALDGALLLARAAADKSPI